MHKSSVSFPLLMLLACAPLCSAGQDIFSDAVQTHVDHIEEFIERFNFEEGSRFEKYTKSTFPDAVIDRDLVVNSLFSKRSDKTKEHIKTQFIKTVTDSSRPVFLEIYDALWYATVPVTMQVEGKQTDIAVTLEIQLNTDYSIEWTVIGMKSDAFEHIENTKDLYISASSHATFFPELREGLKSTKLFENIVSDSQKRSNTQKFMKLIDHKKVTDIKVKKGIAYHFLQISGWIMTVEYFPQDYSLNTGWLISSVTPVNSFLDKRVYQREELGIMSGPQPR
ncbi:MAG: hypothetical protein ABR572_11565 [Cryomorphaceae bacterium]|nr:hypothetical protein [Flavobacteriales bacterium]